MTGSTPAGLAVAVSGFPLRVGLLLEFLSGRGPDAAALAPTLRSRVPPSAVPPFPLVRDRILPVLKHIARLPPREGYAPQNRVVRAPFDGEVVIAYVVEGQFRVTFVTDAMLQAWTLDLAALHDLGLVNLRANTRHILDEIGGPREDYIALDGFDAARLLVADLLIPPGLSDPVLAIPHEHALLIGAAADVEHLRARAAEACQTASLPLTPALYRLGPTGPQRLAEWEQAT